MKLIAGKWGSQRSAKPIDVEFFPNMSGQGGESHLTLIEAGKKGDELKGSKYFQLVFASADEVRELLSQSHIVHHNFYDELQRTEAKRAAGVL